ncbi:MAG: hypothetical protein MRECE_2c142 [Mycoplasmataceae bacterium CE_OT135]|nr:MAG: hypothetical protein MRECE_2c142 [Mycoplasmataceae bacterium CE_OT135]
MSTGSLIFCSALALLCGFLIQQTVETLINTSLTLLPFNIKTVR